MARFRVIKDKFDWYDMVADTNPVTGSRVYHTPMGQAPSVTTILGSLPTPELDAWRDRVGAEEAERITVEATTIGTYMHDMLEAQLRGIAFDYDGSPLEGIARQMAKAIQLIGWRKLNEVWAIEMPVHFGTLYAGRTDLIGVFDRKPSVMDYKTTKFYKSEKYLDKYRMQLAAYGLALEWMFGIRFDHAINFFALRPNIDYKKPAVSHITYMDPEMMHEYKLKWVDVLIDYHQDDATKLIQIEDMIEMVEGSAP